MPAITADYSSSFPSVIFVKEKKNQGLLELPPPPPPFFLNGRNKLGYEFILSVLYGSEMMSRSL